MKIIDLLNKIANGEEVPKKIKYRKCIFEYEEKYKEYFTKNGIIPTTFDTNGIFRNIFLNYNNCLNDEVKIIEEDKKIKIPDKLNWYKNDMTYLDNTMDNDSVIDIILDMQDTINEIIDYLEEKEWN